MAVMTIPMRSGLTTSGVEPVGNPLLVILTIFTLERIRVILRARG